MFIDLDEKTPILVIDADSGLANHLDEMFNGRADASLLNEPEQLTYLIQRSQNCQSAKQLVAQNLEVDNPYQLVFVEFQLPDGDGLNLISELWRQDPDLHMVLCSADAALNWQQIVDTVGESDQLLFLQKPYSALALRQIVHALLRKWQLNKQSQNVMKYMELQIQLRTQQIEEVNRNLMQAEKLAAIGQLAAGIAHEINTPAQYVGDNITAIRDFFESLQMLIDFYHQQLQPLADKEKLTALQKLEQQEDLEFILQDAPFAIQQSLDGIHQIVRIVQAMKGFSQVGVSASTRVNINLALENTLIVSRNSYREFADIETDFGELPAIECFPGELNQVFLNIIINAVHAIEESHKGRGLIRIVTTAIASGVEIRISDSGNGIPAEIRDRIYDPFFTTKVTGKGSGQGLHIAYRIIQQQHGGSLSFETEMGVGTTFIIRLPRKLAET